MAGQLPEAAGGQQLQSDFAYQAVYRYLTCLINEMEAETPIKLPSLRQLAERLSAGMPPYGFQALLRADARTPHQAVVTALDALGQLGFRKVNIATAPEAQK